MVASPVPTVALQQRLSMRAARPREPPRTLLECLILLDHKVVMEHNLDYGLINSPCQHPPSVTQHGYPAGVRFPRTLASRVSCASLVST